MKLAFKEKVKDDDLKKFARGGNVFLINELYFFDGKLMCTFNRNGVQDTLSKGKRRLKFIEPQ